MSKEKISAKNDLLEKMKKIQVLISKAEDIFSSIENEEQEFCLSFHNEGKSINHCLRWGLNATEELLETLQNQPLRLE